jgi:type I restriction enzyme M protein
MNRPSWLRDGQVLVVNARTCGLNKDGVEQYQIDPLTGVRLAHIDDELSRAVEDIRAGSVNGTSARYVASEDIQQARVSVPAYYDRSTILKFEQFVAEHSDQFESRSLGDLVAAGDLLVRKGHGSPSADQRIGDIPYIKVSDLRAGQININPSNRIPQPLAEHFWKGESSGLQPFDLICPERASKNIGEFCVLLPGQERIVLTKEVLIARGQHPWLSQFYLMWALSLAAVRAQWSRVVFMQTNREDVGYRYLEIRIPYPRSEAVSAACALPFQEYFEAVLQAKRDLRTALSTAGFDHHLFFA